ncbi:MAG: hypothetical protein AAFU79_02540 [Myxococcota bacterium]
MAAVVALALLYVTFNIHIEGHTPYGHFKRAGGEKALLRAWDWTKDTAIVAARGAWYYTKEAGYAFAGWVAESAGAASRAARAGWEAWWEDDGRPHKGRRDRSSHPPSRSAGSAHPSGARIRSLSAADERRKVSPASKRSTRVDRVVSPRERAELDRRISDGH